MVIWLVGQNPYPNAFMLKIDFGHFFEPFENGFKNSLVLMDCQWEKKAWLGHV